MHAASEPKQTIDSRGKLRNGLFLKRIVLYEDRISFEVFASREFGADELASLELRDGSEGTYDMAPLPDGSIDGHACIEFRPAPADLLSLHLGQPGWALSSATKTADCPR